jgi:DNA polymerase-3 subunit gamma/tau
MTNDRPRLQYKVHPDGPLHVRHRPTTFDQVVGNRAQVEAFGRLVKTRTMQAYLLTGPSGVGKTTLARIAAAELGCGDGDNGGLLEIDAASHSGIDRLRHIQEITRYGFFPPRCVIMDECHRLPPKAWDVLLKSIEEPPRHLFWMFATTAPLWVPDVIHTRCVHVALKRVADHDLRQLLKDVVARERMRLTGNDINAIVRVARGSPRQALALLATVEAGLSATLLRTPRVRRDLPNGTEGNNV